MKRAQAEIDEKIGDRLPDFSDYASLPFLFAVVKELLRWVPVRLRETAAGNDWQMRIPDRSHRSLCLISSRKTT